MSHANGIVYTKNGDIVGYFEYNGTSDSACTAITKTIDELQQNWRTDKNERDCTRGCDTIDVILYTDYGSGTHWNGRACTVCMAITEGVDPYEEYQNGDYKHEPISGHPFPSNH